VTLRFRVALVLLVAVAGCASAPSPTPPPTPTPTATPASPPTATATASSSGPSSAPTAAVTVDSSLLAVLPPDVNGFAITESPEAETSAAQSSDLAPVATAFAAGLAADPAGRNWAFGVVVALRPGVMSDGVFRAWRDSYDTGACSQAGGVVGHAESKIGSRLTYITACSGGVHTYHVWLPERQRLVSVSAVGEQRFGEQMIAGIRD
jgi:hypothetical protein